MEQLGTTLEEHEGRASPSILLGPLRPQSLLTLSRKECYSQNYCVLSKWKTLPRPTDLWSVSPTQSSAMEPRNPLLLSALQAQPSSSLQQLQQGLQNHGMALIHPWSFYVGSERAEEGNARLDFVDRGAWVGRGSRAWTQLVCGGGREVCLVLS